MKAMVAGFTAVVLSLALAPASSVRAGPLEEGVKAFSRAEYDKAQRLLMPLAEGGDTDAAYTIAMMYQKGEGLPDDKVKAYMWYSLAARKGDKDAIEDRDSLAKDLTPQQVADGKKQADDWVAKH